MAAGRRGRYHPGSLGNNAMRQKLFNFAGQQFVYLAVEAEPGGTLEAQSQALFKRAGAALAPHGLALDRNVVRTRVFGRTREARDVVSGVRGKLFEGSGRAATSSYISPTYFSSDADVGLDLFAMTAPTGGERKVSEHAPVQPFIRHLTWGPMAFLAGMTCETLPTLREQYTDVLGRAGVLLAETGCDWRNVVHVAFFLHRSENPNALLDGIAATGTVPLDNFEVEQVDGYSRPGKLIEIEITAKR
jgi:enamine deaminase RidA (YjgF/YER057c/UK114 family)